MIIKVTPVLIKSNSEGFSSFNKDGHASMQGFFCVQEDLDLSGLLFVLNVAEPLRYEKK